MPYAIIQKAINITANAITLNHTLYLAKKSLKAIANRHDSKPAAKTIKKFFNDINLISATFCFINIASTTNENTAANDVAYATPFIPIKWDSNKFKPTLIKTDVPVTKLGNLLFFAE